jgi:hypothetical protein
VARCCGGCAARRQPDEAARGVLFISALSIMHYYRVVWGAKEGVLVSALKEFW